MKGHLLFLGTGASMGIPVIGCTCAVCLSNLPHNQRLRPSVLIKVNGKQFLIDAGPDLRMQALRYQIDALDGVLFTHAHHDHTAGIDELRAFYYKNKKILPVLASAETAKDLKHRYEYIFHSEHSYEKLVTRIDLQILPDLEGKMIFEGLPISYVSYEQAGMPVNGFKIGDLAYLSDIRHFSPFIFDTLRGVKTIIISALRYTPSAIHFSVDEAVDFIEKAGAERGWLTHISHDLEYEKTNAYLPSHVKLAYDGLEIEFDL